MQARAARARRPRAPPRPPRRAGATVLHPRALGIDVCPSTAYAAVIQELLSTRSVTEYAYKCSLEARRAAENRD